MGEPREISKIYAYHLLRTERAVVNWIGEENTYLQDVEWGFKYFVKDFLSCDLWDCQL